MWLKLFTAAEVESVSCLVLCVCQLNTLVHCWHQQVTTVWRNNAQTWILSPPHPLHLHLHLHGPQWLPVCWGWCGALLFLQVNYLIWPVKYTCLMLSGCRLSLSSCVRLMMDLISVLHCYVIILMPQFPSKATTASWSKLSVWRFTPTNISFSFFFFFSYKSVSDPVCLLSFVSLSADSRCSVSSLASDQENMFNLSERRRLCRLPLNWLIWLMDSSAPPLLMCSMFVSELCVVSLCEVKRFVLRCCFVVPLVSVLVFASLVDLINIVTFLFLLGDLKPPAQLVKDHLMII